MAEIIRGLNSLKRRLSEERQAQIVEQALLAAGGAMKQAVRSRAPVSPANAPSRGGLRESIDLGEIVHDGNRIHVVLKSRGLPKPIDWWTEKGTGIHGPERQRIVPKYAKALRFNWWRKGGDLYFRTSVAGQKPRGYFQRGFSAGKAEAVTRFGRAMDKL